MNSLYRNILLFGFILLANSCYRDLSNYEYIEINEIIITPGTYNYTTPKEGMTAEVILDPVVTQTMTEGTDNLSYQWKRQTAAITWEEVGDEAEYVLEVTSSDVATINFIFAVTDNNLGITTYAEIEVIPIFAFEQCWFLLQDINGQAVLGSVDGEADSRVVTQDIYYQTTGNSLSGSPLFLGIHPFMRTTSIRESLSEDHEILLGVFTSSEQYILNGSTLDFHSTLYYNRILYGKGITGEAADPSLMKGQRRGFAIVDGGNMWYAVHDEFALMYKVRLDETLGNEYDYYAADLCISYGNGNYALVYDSMGERFLFYNNGDLGTGYNNRKTIVESGGTADDTYQNDNLNNTSRLTSLGEYSVDVPNNFDPDNIPTGFVIDDMSMCVGDLANNVLAVGHVGSSFYVYEICMDALTGTVTDMPYCNGNWNFSAEGDLSAYTSRIPATTSDYFTRIFFYAAGPTIYKVDLNDASPRISAIWTAEDANAVVTGLKFKSDNEDIAYIEEGSTDDTYSRKGIIHQLGAVVQYQDESCELVEFEITAAGEIEQDTEGNQTIRVFEGFTNVVDFVFSYREILL